MNPFVSVFLLTDVKVKSKKQFRTVFITSTIMSIIILKDIIYWTIIA